MLAGSVEARFSFGLVMVEAPETTDAHEDWNAGAEKVHARPDSLYVCVRDTAMGLVRISCFDGDQPRSELGLLFSGSLSLPSARLRICDPDESISMVLPVEGKAMTVTIYADDSDAASELQIYLNVQA
jgi:hypothetical protein